jgi:hypothetical protein
MAVFSRARWCFRQCAWPARRHARKNHWRARENTAAVVGKIRDEFISQMASDPASIGSQGVRSRCDNLILNRAAAEEAAEKSSLLSSRAKRGICFFANPEEKADSSGKPRPRNDTFGIFPQLVKLDVTSCEPHKRNLGWLPCRF